jgi:hypothetical protein
VFAYRLHRLHRVHRLGRLGHIADPVLAFAGDITSNRPWARRGLRPRRSAPSIARLLLAGLAVFAFVKVMSAASRPERRSTAEKIALGGLLLLLGAILLAFRRSAVRRGW